MGLVAKSGRCTPIFQGGELYLVRDQQQTTPIMMFNRNNIIKNSLNISYSLSSDQTPNGVAMEFVDESMGYERSFVYVDNTATEVNAPGDQFSQVNLCH